MRNKRFQTRLPWVTQLHQSACTHVDLKSICARDDWVLSNTYQHNPQRKISITREEKTVLISSLFSSEPFNGETDTVLHTSNRICQVSNLIL